MPQDKKKEKRQTNRHLKKEFVFYFFLIYITTISFAIKLCHVYITFSPSEGKALILIKF